MSLKIYNTLSRKKEDFQTLEPGKVRMYVCGPTVYAKAHVRITSYNVCYTKLLRLSRPAGEVVRADDGRRQGGEVTGQGPRSGTRPYSGPVSCRARARCVEIGEEAAGVV